MNRPSPISDDIRAEAAVWLARLRADDRSVADENAFQGWLAASPQHATAFEDMDRVWTAVGGIGGTITRHSEPAQPRPHRRAAIMSGVALLAAGSVGIVAMRSASAQIYETGVGEQKRLSLEDGTLLFLDAQTKVSVAFTDKLRSVDMQFGRANFRVASDRRRPFVVEAAQREIVANQCDFDVRCDGAKVQVVLIHGEANVQPVNAPATTPGIRMQGGERLVATEDSEKFDRPRIAAVTAWQAGFEVFESKRLDEAAAEMNRYSDVKLFVAPGVADMKVSGAYKVGDNAAYANSMTKLLPIEARAQSDGITLQPAENNSSNP
jgi:transmembrane sensor